MENFFKNLDLSRLDEKGKAFVEMAKDGVDVTLGSIKTQSRVIADSAAKTVAIGNQAILDLAAGKHDLDAALRIFRRGSEQLEDLARAEGNLIVSNSVSFLKKIGLTAIHFAKDLLGL